MTKHETYTRPEVIHVLTLPLAPICTSPYELTGDTGTEDVDIYGPEL